ncbi:MAG TPA: hypothetical protein VHE35_22105 [Kofleriaceae bacterium]|nr:hypothetical protein [Kofleriaceae bacterium]
MRSGARLRFVAFGSADDPLVILDVEKGSAQAKYLRCYLHDLGARSILIEPHYFDRDYLAEFSAFYATSTAGYPNVCQRLHVFAREVDRDMFARAVGGCASTRDELRAAYLGHIVLRPLPDAPIGRAVLRTYPDDAGIAAGTPRIMEPARRYDAHVAGVTLSVRGLAWQQQESAVGACATVAIWSMLHASAFDDHHAIPTTAEITLAARHGFPTGRRVFPAADGMRIEQMLEAIKRQGLAPVLVESDDTDGFTRERFCSLVGAFLRSGYPVLVNAVMDDQPRSGHAVCIVGFRSPPPPTVPDRTIEYADANIEIVYVHDDNLGPNVRFRVETDESERGQQVIQLRVEPPRPTHGSLPTDDPTVEYDLLIPTEIVVAVHPELRTDPEQLQTAARSCTDWLPEALDLEMAEQGTSGSTGMLLGCRFIPWVDYVDRELATALGERPAALARARLGLWEQVPPMSLHVGLVRVSLELTPLMDILFDTSDSDRHLRPAAHVVFHQRVSEIRRRWASRLDGADRALDLGVEVQAW